MEIIFNTPSAPKETETEENKQNFHIVTPGEQITSDPAFMRGHGTYAQEDVVMASVAGVVERVNKLISVKPLRTRYTAEIGDVVVGRITEVAQKRWKVDINGKQNAILLLSSVNLPGGVQRRKTELDELNMKSFFSEGDLIGAEVQAFFHDGASSLHTRNLKYGKLRNGSLVVVPPALVRRCKSHFYTLPCGVDLILGLNGYIFVSKHPDKKAEELSPEELYSNKNEEISFYQRSTIARVCNCIKALAKHYMYINDSIIIYAYEASLPYKISDLLHDDICEVIVEKAKLQIEMQQAL
ncbi:hypothetical protein H8356DRAFT_1312924 [Neocallimastix lanati (nom. inval.)]|jgi:exosome complex component RRP4|uniref:Exosome complex component RRP4 n=1 Tax=Neocallimastix californiae TaxID=1754190 RepID=A0A1Y2BU62_9FUNG|nr:hypothetical protein H8356DRAFT_1312924 [Neocallimastix sp. JGI-2020a]ORY38291.1 hypothetical protein LY90DRAFT_459134 [Neocallimastix californiae]|eukprot:ORY38291.1 hypothetical protein LY90DRAFT_459134 [Neocallimastix californiae]